MTYLRLLSSLLMVQLSTDLIKSSTFKRELLSSSESAKLKSLFLHVRVELEISQENLHYVNQ